jgi:hypothetical protein
MLMQQLQSHSSNCLIVDPLKAKELQDLGELSS